MIRIKAEKEMRGKVMVVTVVVYFGPTSLKCQHKVATSVFYKAQLL